MILSPNCTHDRPAEVHSRPCRNCPSNTGDLDPEALGILSSGDPEWLRESLFPCAWRPQKLCKAWHDLVQERLAGLEGGDS